MFIFPKNLNIEPATLQFVLESGNREFPSLESPYVPWLHPSGACNTRSALRFPRCHRNPRTGPLLSDTEFGLGLAGGAMNSPPYSGYPAILPTGLTYPVLPTWLEGSSCNQTPHLSARRWTCLSSSDFGLYKKDAPSSFSAAL